MPNFSIIVPLFNKAEFVVDAVFSILAQEIGDLEIIVVDDGSTDDGVQRLATLADSRLVILRQLNAGVAVARNVGIAAAHGDFICFLDADDLWAPDHLKKINELINQDPEAIAWATGYTEISQLSSLSTIANYTSPAHATSKRFNQYEFMLLWSCLPFFWTGSITVRATTLRELQPCFPPGERLGEDQDLWFRLSEREHIRFSDVRTTAFYRRGVDNSLTSTDILAPLPAFMRLIERTSGQAPRERRAARHLFNIHLLHVAWNNCLADRRSVALGLLWKVVPSARLLYWLRIFICSLLPVRIVRGVIALTRSKGISNQ